MGSHTDGRQKPVKDSPLERSSGRYCCDESRRFTNTSATASGDKASRPLATRTLKGRLGDYGQPLRCQHLTRQRVMSTSDRLHFTSTLPTISPANNKAQHTAPFLWSWCHRTRSHWVKSLHRSFLGPVSQGAHEHATPTTTDTLSVHHDTRPANSDLQTHPVRAGFGQGRGEALGAF